MREWHPVAWQSVWTRKGTISGVAAALLVIGGALAGLVTWRSKSAEPIGNAQLAGRAPGPDAHAQIQRGRYLVAIGDCAGCHTRRNGPAFAGGVRFPTPFGVIYSPNITPDPEMGIGKWTAQDLRRAMHEGIGPGGRHLFPAFPYRYFTHVSDADIDAIYSYLRTLKPIHARPPSNGLLFTQRWSMAIWNMLFFKPGRFRPESDRGTEWNRGAYLVEGLGHCGACHTPRNWLMAPVSDRRYAGGTLEEEVGPGKYRRWSAVNLTPARGGLSSWSVDELTQYLKTGFSLRAGVFGPMNAVIMNGTSHLSTADAHAMAVYLKGVRPQPESDPPGIRKDFADGARIYRNRCEQCHMSSGRGNFFDAPPLDRSAVVQASDPASLINVILYGPVTPKAIRFGDWETMKPYDSVLNDKQVAAVCNFMRNSWGNRRGSVVTTRDVAQQR